MWHKVTILGNEYFLYVRNGQVSQVRVGTNHHPASEFHWMFPDLYNSLVNKYHLSVHNTITSKVTQEA